MFYVYLILISCSVLAFVYDFGVTDSVVSDGGNIAAIKKNTNVFSKIAFFVLVVTLVLFAGLRSDVNDTIIYSSGFQHVNMNLKNLDWSLGNNPFFVIYEVLFRRYISTSSNVFFLLTSLFVESSYLLFFRKYSINLGQTVYIFIAFTLYAFTMAALKQVIAIAMLIWVVPSLLNKKYFRAILIIAVATLFHAYSFVFLVAFILDKSIWDKRAALVILGTLVIMFFFTRFVGETLEFTDSIKGNLYTEEDFEKGTSLFRVGVYLVPSILSFYYRRELREVESPFLNMCVNLSLVSTCFMVLSAFGGANLTGRVAGYFDIFMCFLFPAIFRYGIKDVRVRRIVIVLSFVLFAIYYYNYYKKFLEVDSSFFADYYNHKSLSYVIENW